jgi:shikimate kinase
MPGGGKSTVGKRLAQRLGLPFNDSDERIEQVSGRTVARMFELEGEAAFRDRESQVLADLVAEGPGVIATGGGAILRASNRALLRERTLPIYLHTSVDELWRRVRRNRRRPLLQVSDPRARLETMYQERHPLYQEVAALTVGTGAPPLSEVVDLIVQQLATSDLSSGAPRP